MTHDHQRKDPIDGNIEQLEVIRNIPNLPKDKLEKIEKEQRILRAGNKGEQDSAYFIDFYYKDSKNWAIIHDLRIEHKGYVAQIDHLLINRFLDFYVLETKHYSQGVKVTEHGEFLVWHQKRYLSIESPIEQNKRHVKVLKSLLKEEEMLPKRLGVSLLPGFRPYILVSPKSRVIRPSKKAFNTDMLIKADEFHKQTQDNLDNEGMLATFGSMAKTISQASVKEIAEKLARCHKPITINYYDKFGISKKQIDKPLINTKKITHLPNPAKQKTEENSKYYCYKCKNAISEKVALFCFNNKIRFKGRAYCYGCQKSFSK